MSKVNLDLHIETQYDDGVYLYATIKQKPGLIATGVDIPDLFNDLVGAIEEWDKASKKR